MTFSVLTLEAHEDGGRSQGHQDCGGGRDGAHSFPHPACFSVHVRNCLHRVERNNFVMLSTKIQAMEVDLVTGAHLSGNLVVHRELVMVLQGRAAPASVAEHVAPVSAMYAARAPEAEFIAPALQCLLLSSWIGGLAFEGWTLQVGCLVLVVFGTFRSSDATLKTTAPDFGVCCTSHFRKVEFKHSMFKSSVGAACAVLVRGRPLDIERAKECAQ